MFLVTVVLADGSMRTVAANVFTSELSGIALDLSGALKRGVIQSIVIKESKPETLAEAKAEEQKQQQQEQQPEPLAVGDTVVRIGPSDDNYNIWTGERYVVNAIYHDTITLEGRAGTWNADYFRKTVD